ncbi:hypothetical protein LUX29_12300 [Aureimonas altamirensis]|uniref:hypothetical protein n=1 Tax=Aureimonas altamirensis TaxID=370622 RepID=UPI001E52CA82|nr:hypothetical protein [Aureimonas altamirensis]UHD43875.1 hypothetical protein LUX29_12300 [Aureimonas altamirensis]
MADSGLIADTTTPTVSSLSITGQTGRQNGLLNAGDTVTFSAAFSEAVFVDAAVGAPVLKVNVSGQLRNAEYVSGSGSTTLLFRLTIVAGDSDLVEQAD